VRHAPDFFARRTDGTGLVIDVRADDRIALRLHRHQPGTLPGLSEYLHRRTGRQGGHPSWTRSRTRSAPSSSRKQTTLTSPRGPRKRSSTGWSPSTERPTSPTPPSATTSPAAGYCGRGPGESRRQPRPVPSARPPETPRRRRRRPTAPSARGTCQDCATCLTSATTWKTTAATAGPCCATPSAPNATSTSRPASPCTQTSPHSCSHQAPTRCAGAADNCPSSPRPRHAATG
jgi:hypothetical protein